MINVGMIGLGRMGRLHMMKCLHIDDVKVVAAADPSKKALNKAKALGISKLYTDYHDLLTHSSDMDAVVMSLPNFLHFENIQLAPARARIQPIENWILKSCYERKTWRIRRHYDSWRKNGYIQRNLSQRRLCFLKMVMEFSI